MRKLVSIVLGLVLTACASGTPPPAISYDETDFQPAVVEAPLRPVEIVRVPEPLPLPGQLKPLPVESPDKGEELIFPEERVEAGNAAARVEPSAGGYINAIQVYPYTAGALYRLYAAPEQVTDIALQPGEELVSVSAGDTVRWVLGDTTSGEGAGLRVHILVKPVAPDLATNLVITTSRRAYHLELRSAEDTYMAAVSWSYPQDELIALQRRNDRALAQEAVRADSGVDLGNLRFRYAITGGDPPWRPLRAFDDGRKVYIQFPSGLYQGEAPPLFVVGPQGDSELVNYRVRGSYYVVDRLFAAAELRLGEDPQAVVRIERRDGRRSEPDAWEHGT